MQPRPNSALLELFGIGQDTGVFLPSSDHLRARQGGHIHDQIKLLQPTLLEKEKEEKSPRVEEWIRIVRNLKLVCALKRYPNQTHIQNEQ